jgi:hypothetical protein
MTPDARMLARGIAMVGAFGVFGSLLLAGWLLPAELRGGRALSRSARSRSPPGRHGSLENAYAKIRPIR